jgi:hypothetical protein
MKLNMSKYVIQLGGAKPEVAISCYEMYVLKMNYPAGEQRGISKGNLTQKVVGN